MLQGNGIVVTERRVLTEGNNCSTIDSCLKSIPPSPITTHAPRFAAQYPHVHLYPPDSTGELGSIWAGELDHDGTWTWCTGQSHWTQHNCDTQQQSSITHGPSDDTALRVSHTRRGLHPRASGAGVEVSIIRVNAALIQEMPGGSVFPHLQETVRLNENSIIQIELQLHVYA